MLSTNSDNDEDVAVSAIMSKENGGRKRQRVIKDLNEQEPEALAGVDDGVRNFLYCLLDYKICNNLFRLIGPACWTFLSRQ